ncbi:nucleotidyltransferase domain-containing protein, partial [Archaeoglobus sp.]
YVFGSVVRGDYSVGLSDIDVAIVSDEFESREKKLEIYDLLFERYFDTPFEFHLLTRKAWRFYRRFVGDEFIKV